MTKERLSKLQEWILKKCYEETYFDWKKQRNIKYGINRDKLIDESDEFYDKRFDNAREVAVTNSIKLLFKKDLIDVMIMDFNDRPTLKEYIEKRIKIWGSQIRKIKNGEEFKDYDTGEITTVKDYEDSIENFKEILKNKDLRGWTVKRIKLTQKGKNLIIKKNIYNLLNNKKSLKIKKKK